MLHRFMPVLFSSSSAHWIALIGWVALLLTGCASTRPSSPPADVASASPTADSMAHQLKRAAEDWAGTPYRLGGTDRSGIDCSGFVAHLYAVVLNRSVPRTTADQARTGRPVQTDALQPGDLIFFQLPRKQRHVGVYLRDNRFTHASVSEGVTISDLEDAYWQRNYWTARRLLPDLSSPKSAGPAAPTKHTPPSRSGW